MSPGSWMVYWVKMVGSGGQESFLCRHCWSTALAFVKGALQSLRQLHWALATGCQSCGKKSQSFYYLPHLPAEEPQESCLAPLAPKMVQLTLGCTAFLRKAPGMRLWVLWWHETLGFMRGNIFGAEPSTLDEVFIYLSPQFSGGKSHKRVPWQ